MAVPGAAIPKGSLELSFGVSSLNEIPSLAVSSQSCCFRPFCSWEAVLEITASQKNCGLQEMPRDCGTTGCDTRDVMARSKQRKKNTPYLTELFFFYSLPPFFFNFFSFTSKGWIKCAWPKKKNMCTLL